MRAGRPRWRSVARVEVELGLAARRLAGPSPHDALVACTLVLRELLGDSVSLRALGARVRRVDERAPARAHSFTARLEHPSSSSFAALVVDLGVIEAAIDALTGASQEETRRLGPLSPGDAGVATYLVLRCLDAAVTYGGGDGLLLCATNVSEDEFRALGAPLVEASWRVQIGAISGWARLLLPRPLLLELARLPLPGRARAPAGPRARARLEARLDLGRARLSAAQLATLEAGDVVLLEEHALDAEGLPARLRVGVGQGDYLAARPSAEGGRWAAQIESIEVHEDGDEEVTMDDEQGEETPRFAEMAKLSMWARVGASSITAGELFALHGGQILDLGVSVDEPVDLMVGGERIARAELVEIEGRLGVRILST